MAGYTLYGRRGSGSFAVEVALEEIGVHYDVAWIGQDAEEVAAFRNINPTCKVPALALPDGTLMFESAAILIHLSLAHPTAGLAPPPGTGEHARFLKWLVFLSTNVYEALLRVYYPARYSSRGETDAAAIREQGSRDLQAHFELIATAMTPLVLGTEYSIADVYLYMLVGWLPDGTTALHERLPIFGAHSRAMASRPSVVKVESRHAGSSL